MKRLLAFLLAAALLFSATFAAAEEDDGFYVPDRSEIALTGRPVSEEPTHITVGNTTGVKGSFFTTQFGNNTSDIDVRAMINGYNPIVWATQVDFIPDPMVVESLDKDVDAAGNTVYTLHLMQDLTYNDGETAITAADYVFSYLLLASDEFLAIGANTAPWLHVVGFEAYAAGQSDAFAGIHLIDEYTYSVTVKKEYEPYFYELSYLSASPYPVSVLAPGCKVVDTPRGAIIVNEDEEILEPIFTPELLEVTVLDAETGYLSHPRLTSGPYSLTDYDKEAEVCEFALNPFYKGNWEGVVPVIDYVTLVRAEQDTMVDKLVEGEIDLLNKVVDGKTIVAGRAYLEDGFSFTTYARLGYGYLAFACEKGPQQFEAVRHAVAYAFDTEAFTRQLTLGFGLPVKSYYGIGQWMYLAATGTLRPEEMTPEMEAEWDSVTLDDVVEYPYDLEAALDELIRDGWTLNAEGKPFDPETDEVRHKKLKDGSLMPLSFRFAQCENNDGAALAVAMLTEAFAELGAELIVEVVPFNTLLADYYRTDGLRRYDMNFMATNFVSTFDPYMTFSGDERYAGVVNTSGLYDQKLTEHSWLMHTTPPQMLLTFLKHWVDFEARFAELLPTMPIYSNVYVDFYSDWLQNYSINAETNWPTAILYAFWAEPEAEEEGEDEFGGEEFEDDGFELDDDFEDDDFEFDDDDLELDDDEMEFDD